MVLKQLSEEEKDARARALAEARQREAEERERVKETAVQEALLAEQHAKEAQEAEKRKRKEAEEKAKRAAKEEAEAEVKAKTEEAPRAKHLKPEPEKQPDTRHKKGTAAPRRGEERRVRGRLTITNALDEEQRQRSLASLKRHRERQKKQVTGPQSTQKIAREVTIPEIITIQELANRMAERGVDVIKYLMKDSKRYLDLLQALRDGKEFSAAFSASFRGSVLQVAKDWVNETGR